MKNLRFVLMASVGLIASSAALAQNVQSCQPLSYSSLDVGGCKIIGQQVFDSRSGEVNTVANSVEALKLESRIPSYTGTTNSSAVSPSSTSGASTTTSTTVPASSSSPSSTSGASTTRVELPVTLPSTPSNPPFSDGPIAAPEAPVVGNNTQEAAIMEKLNAVESKKPYLGNYKRTLEQRVEVSTYNRVDTRDARSIDVKVERVAVENTNSGGNSNPNNGGNNDNANNNDDGIGGIDPNDPGSSNDDNTNDND
ncbi:MAG TPA: hypothetical protein PKC68_01295 [Alphaproteobacteria bacterium]|nr:hypothetical protein [Alphaproteobacteria bacterium]